MKKKRVAVAMGGYSGEYEVSIGSGRVVCEHLNKDKYEVYPITISEKGWFYTPNTEVELPIDKADFSFIADGEKIIPDVVFNTIHGTPGEDGYLQAYFSLINIPQTSADFYPAALSFNKRDCLSVLKNFGVHCANSYFLNKNMAYDIQAVSTTVGLPCFVKPNRAGSSLGISKVNNLDELVPAIEKAFKTDDEILIETALIGTEVQVGVYTHQGKEIALPATEIVSHNEFFDYKAKYHGESEEITPARISEIDTKRVQEEAIKIHRILNMKGITRTDFIIQDGTPYFLEMNTTPGLSIESIVPKQAREAGLSLEELFDILVQEALNK